MNHSLKSPSSLKAIARRGRTPCGFAALPSIALSLVLALSLAGCVGAVLGGGAAVGVAAYQERGVGGFSRDLRISVQIAEAFLSHNHELPVKVIVTVFEGRVLLAGHVDAAQMQADAVRLVWTVPGVVEVLNEIEVAGGGGLLDTARDGWITTQLKSKMTFDQEVYAINYSVETVNGAIYLIGIAQNRAELARVVGHARSIDYVRRVVNHVRLKDGS